MSYMSTTYPYIYIMGTDTYTSWDSNSVTAVSSLPSPYSGGASTANSWLKIKITGAPHTYNITEAEQRTGNIYANLRLESMDYVIGLAPLLFADESATSVHDALAVILNKAYIYIETGTYPDGTGAAGSDSHKLNTSGNCIAVACTSFSQDTDFEHGSKKIELTLRKRQISL